MGLGVVWPLDKLPPVDGWTPQTGSKEGYPFTLGNGFFESFFRLKIYACVHCTFSNFAVVIAPRYTHSTMGVTHCNPPFGKTFDNFIDEDICPA